MVGVSTPPPADVLDLSTHHELEIETRADLDRHLAAGTLAGKTVQGMASTWTRRT